MSWQTRTSSANGYYYRSIRVGGRVRTQYFGGGLTGECAAAMDQLAKLERLEGRERLRDHLERERRADAALGRLGEAARLLAHAALLAAGYHQHDRGEWRMKRVRKH
jgi:hypothetical protein